MAEKMHWDRLICDKRLGLEHYHENKGGIRSDFQRDYDRLIFSSPFRRLQNKTQVFPLPGSIFVHNRLTHSLEVSCVGKSLAREIATRLWSRYEAEPWAGKLFDMGEIVAAACLAHDLGNPPFGHSGEKAIQAFFREGAGQKLQTHLSPDFWNDLIHFEGNANAFRLLTHRFHGRREGGFVMTYAMLASIVKYPFESHWAGTHGKFGFFCTERESFVRIATELGIRRLSAEGEPLRYARHPLVYLVEAADDICYEIMDIEDSHKLKILSYEETADLFLSFFDEETRRNIQQRAKDEGVSDENEEIVYMRACVIGKLENECAKAFCDHEEEILDGTFEGCLIDHITPEVRDAYRRCQKLSVRKIYNSKPVLDVELSGYKIMETLMETLVDAACRPDNYHSKQLIRRFSSQYDIESEDLETRIMAVIDFISGMTDIFALDFYQKINGTSLPIV